jgi:threonine dehydrogenase-like Zn-dependent dehydrogenase
MRLAYATLPGEPMSLPRLRLPIILGTSIFIVGSWVVFDSGSFPCAAAQIVKATILGPGSVEVAAFAIGEKRSNEPKLHGNGVAGQRIKLDQLVTHKYALDDIQAAYELFGKQEVGVIKLALKP